MTFYILCFLTHNLEMDKDGFPFLSVFTVRQLKCGNKYGITFLWQQKELPLLAFKTYVWPEADLLKRHLLLGSLNWARNGCSNIGIYSFTIIKLEHECRCIQLYLYLLSQN